MGKYSLSVIMFSSALLGTVALSASSQAADLAEAAQAAAKAAAEKAAMGMLPLKPFAGAKGFVAYAPDGDFYTPGTGRTKFFEYNIGWNAAAFAGVNAGDMVKLQLDTGYISNTIANLAGVSSGSGSVGAAYIMGGVTLAGPLKPLTDKVIPFAGISVGAAFPVLGTISGDLADQNFTIKGSQSTVPALLARAGVTVAINPKLGATLEYGFFQTADFSVNVNGPDGAPLSSSGNGSMDISAHLFGIGFEYNF